jgi:hypothetical protein
MKHLIAASALVVTMILGGAVQAAVIHNDGATDFNGTYRGVGSFDVNFAGAAGPSAVSFDIFGARSVDGQGNGYDDLFEVMLNGTTVFAGLFNMSGGGTNAVTTNLYGWTWSTMTNPGGLFQGGMTSVNGVMDLLAGANTLTFSFTSPGPSNGGNQGVGDESWAINNLDVSPVPVPAGLPLLAGGLGLLAFLRRKSA